MARREKREAAKAAEATPFNDADTVYNPDLTGKDIDLLGNLIDAWVKSGGVQVVAMAMPLLDKITAPRKAAMKAKDA
jgi:hypothetical protein